MAIFVGLEHSCIFFNHPVCHDIICRDVISYLVTSYLVTSYLVMSYLVTSYLVTSYVVTSYRVFHKNCTVFILQFSRQPGIGFSNPFLSWEAAASTNRNLTD